VWLIAHAVYALTHGDRPGSGIQLRGNAAKADDYSPPTDALADRPEEGSHTLSFTARTFSPDSFVSTSDGLLSSSASSRSVVVADQQIDDKDIAFRGEWSFVNDPAGFNSSYHISHNDGDQAMLEFTGTPRCSLKKTALTYMLICPGSGIAVSGFANSTSGSFNATLDGETTILNSKALYSQSTVLFFQTGLDPSKQHKLTITNSADSLLAIGTVHVTTVSSG
jgi:hypothetical protein